MIDGATLHDLLRSEGLYGDVAVEPFGSLPHRQRDALDRAASWLNARERAGLQADSTFPDPVTTPPAAPTVEGTSVTRDVGR